MKGDYSRLTFIIPTCVGRLMLMSKVMEVTSKQEARAPAHQCFTPKICYETHVITNSLKQSRAISPFLHSYLGIRSSYILTNACLRYVHHSQTKALHVGLF